MPIYGPRTNKLLTISFNHFHSTIICTFQFKAYKAYLQTISDGNPCKLDQSILFLKHTSRMIEFISDKYAVYQSNDIRLQYLQEALQFFIDWQKETKETKRHFLSDKLWFDLNSMILGFRYLVSFKLQKFAGSMVKPAIMNQDVVENHFSQLRSANGQNENPTYLLATATQNAVIFGQATISKKSNTGCKQKRYFTELPKENLFSRKS